MVHCGLVAAGIEYIVVWGTLWGRVHCGLVEAGVGTLLVSHGWERVHCGGGVHYEVVGYIVRWGTF